MTEAEKAYNRRLMAEGQERRRKEAERKKNEPVDFPYVDECRKVYNDYLSAREKHNEGFGELKRKHIGDELKRQTNEHKKLAPDADKAVSAIKAYTKIYLDHLAALEAAAMNAENITADFELLRLPLTLSPEELQTLHARNCNNQLFCRALREYFAKHEADYDRSVSLDLRDSISVRREIVEDIAKELEKGIRFPDFDGFAQAGTEMLLDMYKERLSGNGLFSQPKIIEPTDAGDVE